ncbi:MAG: hypothetical protein CMO55_23115 [Verrucomicrobiales bacterium]|nr:hypothetical protein [Verrucomicrobiales bacterium]
MSGTNIYFGKNPNVVGEVVLTECLITKVSSDELISRFPLVSPAFKPLPDRDLCCFSRKNPIFLHKNPPEKDERKFFVIMEKSSDPSQPLGICLKDVIALYGSESLVRDSIKAGRLKPLVRRGRLTLFSRRDVIENWERIAGGDLPPKL